MGSLVKDARNRSKFWYACYRSGSKRLKKSTHTADRKTALKILQALERGEELAAAGSLTEDRLRTLLNDTMERVNGKRSNDPTVRQWFAQWLQNQQSTVQPKTLARYKYALDQFMKHLGNRSDARLETVSSQDVLNFRDQLFKSGLAPSTVNLLRKLVALPFISAHEDRLITFVPTAGVKEIPDHDKPEKGIFNAEQIQALLNVADTDWRGLVLCGYYTGQRFSDLAGLPWSNVDLSERTITFIQKKTRTKVVIPIHGALLDHLLTLPAPDSNSAPVFPTLCKIPVSGTKGLSTLFRNLLEQAGIKPGFGRVRNGNLGRSTSHLSFHSLRHTFNSNMANLNVAQEIRQRLTGHLNTEQNTHYTQLEIATMRNAIDKIPRLQG